MASDELNRRVEPMSIRAIVSVSRPGNRLLLGDRPGLVTDQPEWMSLDVRVTFELDQRSRPQFHH